MARSQETYSKKEKEKNKVQKRKEKEQRKEERKLNSDGNKNWESMIAYVDEFGRITSTPPDPANKTIINVDDIVTGAAKREPEGDIVRTGTVVFFNEDKGYRFIKDIATNESIFVHANGLEDRIKENDKVNFQSESGLKGLQAVKVKLV